MMRFARALLVVLFGATFAVLAVPASAQTASAQRGAPQVYLLRGLANIFSLGMDDLTRKLNERGIRAAVYPYTEWKTLAATAAERSRQSGGKSPVIIIGHSLGADSAIYMANRVVELGAPVPLVVTFDPVTPTVASPAIGKVVNYYQAGGSGKPVRGPRVSNIDLTRTGNLSHFNIDKAANLHEQVIAMIAKPAPAARKPRPKPATPPASTVTTTDPVATPAAATAEPASTSAAAAATPAATPAAAAAPASVEPKPAAPM